MSLTELSRPGIQLDNASVEEGKGYSRSQESSAGKNLRCLKLAVIILAVVSLVLFIVCFALIATVKQDVDDMNKDDGGSSSRFTLTTSPVSPDGTEFVSELYRGAGQWALKTPLPYAASDVATTECEGKIYIAGGLVSSTNETLSSRVIEFDPVFETYADLAPLPSPRYRHGIACVKVGSSRKLFAAAGYTSLANGANGLPEGAVLEYTVTTASNTGPSQWTASTTLNVPRGDAAIAQLGSSIYLFGGYGANYDMTQSGSSLEILDASQPSPAWTLGPPMQSSRGDVKAAVLGTKIYVVGGWMDGFLDTVEAFDTVTLTWQMLAPLPLARGDPAVAVVANSLVVVGGEVSSGVQSPCDWDPTIDCDVNEIPVHNVEQYDPETDYWTPLAPLPTARFRFDASSANGALYVFGGHRIANVEVNSVDGLYIVDHPHVFVHVNT
eukprot:CAMPEP_0184493472 /NCGR_PEP_ID=MMETSP0113_2-20130426/26087_1 /TAXON_ID=91329 /ORGANISM="Norrisiella sphaerica, Strain BC52" /LENGTH=439 /DNA_ID=CAMNT_0026878735 /DNA_START=14 /DNA_END=1333 /DNA_ORIENTATION=+